MSKKKSDHIFHPPSGSNVPGKVEANPYVFMPPKELQRLEKITKDKEELAKIQSAIKQWGRIYQYPGYPFKLARNLRKLACELIRRAAINDPSINLPYYQDGNIPEGLEDIENGLSEQYNNYDQVRFDLKRDGERPFRDSEFYDGGFTNPKEGIPCVHVEPRGEGEDPWGMDNPFPPTGGDIDRL